MPFLLGETRIIRGSFLTLMKQRVGSLLGLKADESDERWYSQTSSPDATCLYLDENQGQLDY